MKPKTLKYNIEFSNMLKSGRCIKCGGDGIKTYHSSLNDCSRVRVVGRVYIYKERFDKEHIHFVCNDCAFEWIENVLPTGMWKVEE